MLLLAAILVATFYRLPLQTTMPANTVTVTPSGTPRQTVTTQPGYDVVILYTEKYSNDEIGRNEPKQGLTFLVLTLQIKNNIGGYRIDPMYFHVIVNDVKYGLDSATYSLPDALQSVDLQAGGTISGNLVFQVPIGTADYTPTCEHPFRHVSIN